MEKLSEVFSIIKKGLKDNGKFVFDIRRWDISEKADQLFQSGREINKYSTLGTSVFDGDEIEYSEMCSYIGERQNISYRINNLSKSVEESFMLSYLMFTKETAGDSLINSGFKRIDEVITNSNYTYQVISAS